MTALLPAACALAVCGPAFLSVCRLTARRAYAPLVRGSLERSCVLAASGIAAISITAQLGLAASAFSCQAVYPLETFQAVAWRGFFLFGAPSIASAAWATGELLSGESARSEPSFAAAAVAAYAAGLVAFGTTAGKQFSPGLSLACAAASSAFASSAAYLAARGATPAR